jgi:lipoate-protein ligase A
MTPLPRGWYCLIEAVPFAGAEQMARDAGLRDLAAMLGAPILRLYTWLPACISFGAHESAARRFSPQAIATLGLDVVRRPSGGRAVLHRSDLTYAVALPAAALPALADTLDGVHQIVAAALDALGLAASAAPRRRAPAPDAGGICFDAPLGGELLLDGRKVLGSAQHVAGGVLLQHGSLLLQDGQADLHRCLDAAPASAAPPATQTISAALGRSIAFPEMADLLLAAWTRATGPTRPLATAAVAAAAAPHRAQFADPAWTWRR